MAVIKADALLSAFKGGFGKYAGALICGPNWDLANRLKSDVIASYSHNYPDGELVRLVDNDVSADAGLLLQELQSLSMFGSSRLIVIDASSPTSHKACIGALSVGWSGCGLLVVSGDLKKSSPLRKEFEAHPDLLTVICYEQSRQDLVRLVRTKLENASIDVETDVSGYIVDTLDGNAGLVENEVAKLIEYAGLNKTLTINDVFAVGAVNEAGSVDNLIDAMFMGDSALSLNALGNLKDQGVQPASILIAITNHYELLLELSILTSSGQSPATVVKMHKPPIFYKRQPALTEQLVRNDLDGLSRLVENLQTSNKEVRLNPSISWPLAERLVLSVCGYIKRRQRTSSRN